MTNLDKIKDEAIERLDKVIDPIYSNAECSFAENLHVELRELLSSEIDRAVGVAMEEATRLLDKEILHKPTKNHDYCEEGQDREGCGCHYDSYNMAIRQSQKLLNNLLQKLSSLNEKP